MDSENDISCLGGSYLFVSSLRYSMVGSQPTMAGAIMGETPWHAVYELYVAGLVMTTCGILVILLRSRLVRTDEEKEGATNRALTILAGMLGMGFAWCCLFASRTVFEKEPTLDAHHVSMKTVSGRILLALSLSLVSMLIIFALDFVGDFFKERSPAGEDNGSDIIQQIVSAKSILVGFSWEHAFDGGVEAIASRSTQPMITQSVLAAAVFLVVVPAWRRHILTKAMILQAYYKAQKESDAKDGYFPVPGKE